jgi:hypothetical protein
MKTNRKGYEKNIREIIAYVESIKTYLKEYEEKEEALMSLSHIISPADARGIREELLKQYSEWSLDSIAHMREQIAELEYRFGLYI